jgi:hypothetical protein
MGYFYAFFFTPGSAPNIRKNPSNKHHKKRINKSKRTLYNILTRHQTPKKEGQTAPASPKPKKIKKDGSPPKHPTNQKKDAPKSTPTPPHPSLVTLHSSPLTRPPHSSLFTLHS